MFENQGQFDGADAAAPAAGTAIEGGWRRVHVNDILAEHGPRRGPVDDAWSRVSVVVSRDGLLSRPRRSATGTSSRPGTRRPRARPRGRAFPRSSRPPAARVPLRTDVTPTSAAKIAATVETGDMPVAPGEFRGVQLDAPVPARIAVGESVTIAGTVTTMERADFTHACAAWTLPGTFRAQLFECDSIAGNRFSIPHRFAAADAGRHQLQIFLYYPDPGSPSPPFLLGLVAHLRQHGGRPQRPRGPRPSGRGPAAERPTPPRRARARAAALRPPTAFLCADMATIVPPAAMATPRKGHSSATTAARSSIRCTGPDGGRPTRRRRVGPTAGPAAPVAVYAAARAERSSRRCSTNRTRVTPRRQDRVRPREPAQPRRRTQAVYPRPQLREVDGADRRHAGRDLGVGERRRTALHRHRERLGSWSGRRGRTRSRGSWPCPRPPRPA